MATTSKAPKPSKAMTAAATKAAARGAAKVPAKAVAAAAKQAKAPPRKTAPAKVAARPAAVSSFAQPAKTPLLTAKPGIPAEQRRHYIEVAAYFIAERSGFSADNALDHWTQAEAEIDHLLLEGKLNI